jgi:hypothetical protein
VVVKVRLRPETVERLKEGFECQWVGFHVIDPFAFDLYVEFAEASEFGVQAPDGTPRADGTLVGEPWADEVES